MWAYRLTDNVDHSYQLPVLIDLADWWSIPSHQSIRSPFGDLLRHLDRTGAVRGIDLRAGESDKRVDAGSLLKSRDAIKYRASDASHTRRCIEEAAYGNDASISLDQQAIYPCITGQRCRDSFRRSQT